MDKKVACRREKWIDRCRGLAIIIVLLGHTNPPFRKLLYGFHMPVFFILSGYIFRTYNTVGEFKKYVKKIANSYLSPYFLFCTVNYIITIVMYALIDKEKVFEKWKVYIWGILYARGTKEWMPNCSPLWFLTAMFCTMLMLFLIMKQGEKIQHIMVTILLLFSSALYMIEIPKLPWNIDTAFLAVSFCYGGVVLAKRDMINLFVNWKSQKQILCMIGCLITGIVSVLGNKNIKEVSLDNCIYGNYFFMVLGAWGISIAFIMFAILCQYYVDTYVSKISLINIIDKYVLWIGKHTILIIAFDYQSMSIAVRIARELLGKENWVFIFGMKMLIISTVIIGWTSIVKLVPKKIRKLMTY